MINTLFRNQLRNLTLALAFSLSFSCLSAQNLKIESVPSWVKEINHTSDSKISKYDVTNGFYYSLIDYQINLGEQADFTHQKYNILSQAGVDNGSEIMISYDTSYQTVSFHYLYIWRYGKKIDKTSELKFETIKNEQNLQSNIYSGHITSYAILDDVRKNDIVEFAYTIWGDNPIFDGGQFRLTPIDDINPIDYVSIVILHPEDEKIYSSCDNCKDIEIKESKIGKIKSLEITKENIEAIDYEESAPPWYLPFQIFVISNYKNWKEVNEWAQSIFETDDEQNLNLVFEEIFHGDETTDEKIHALINYVQNDIRYMGIESGIGSIKPFPPKQVINQRFGDCKDKSLLLVRLLEEVGVEASPALVNSTIYHGIDDFLPSAHLFDHCIVHYEYEGKEYWIDPTTSHQGGNFKNKAIIDYGKALIVKPNTTELTEMNIVDTISGAKVIEEFNIPSKDIDSATLTVTTTFYGLDADLMRATFEYLSRKEISEYFKSLYTPLFPNMVEIDRIEIEDDLEKNTITLKENYHLTRIWYDDDNSFIPRTMFQYEPMSVYSYIVLLSCEEKNYPVLVPFPSKFNQTTILNLPDAIQIESDKYTVDNDAFYFKKEVQELENNTLKLSYNYYTKKQEIEAKGFMEICGDMNDAIRELPLQVSYPKTGAFKPKFSIDSYKNLQTPR